MPGVSGFNFEVSMTDCWHNPAVSRPVHPGPMSGFTIDPSPPIVHPLPPTCCRNALRPMPRPSAGGARFAIDSSNQAKADAICRRYVANGAYQAWARDFGQICPAPDFEGARTFWVRRIADWVTRTAGSVWRHISLVAAMAVAAVLLATIVRRGRILRGRQS